MILLGCLELDCNAWFCGFYLSFIFSRKCMVTGVQCSKHSVYNYNKKIKRCTEGVEKLFV